MNFLLVHGGCHGTWCWERVAQTLHARGHVTVAVQCPVDTPGLTTIDYASVIADAANERGDDFVLVVHSICGLVAPFVADRVGLRHVVFLNALLQEGAFGGAVWPDPSELPMLSIPLSALAVDERGLFELAPDAAAYYFYSPDCSAEDIEWAVARLRPQAISVLMPPPEYRDLPADLPRTYVLGTEDRAVLPAWSRWAARELLGAEVVELPGGHSPFLARPDELAAVLVDVVRPSQDASTGR
jgi:pimeloyl-ACP methyl ester carboxylesterase